MGVYVVDGNAVTKSIPATMLVLLTGYSSYVGKTIQAALWDHGIQVTTLGRPINGRLPDVPVDLYSVDDLSRWVIRPVDAVIHAARSRAGEDCHSLDRAVLSLAAESSIPLLYLSTTHDHNTLYCRGKRASEIWLCGRGGCSASTILRMGHVYGENHPAAYLCRRVRLLRSGFPFSVNPAYADRYTYVADVAEYAARWAECPPARKSALEISCTMSHLELDRRICEQLTRFPPIPLPLEWVGRYVPRRVVTMCSALGWNVGSIVVPRSPVYAGELPDQQWIRSDPARGLAATVKYCAMGPS
jgi:nucleoside-diphosphate-sugar epimerase